jgi:antitoxin component YwqK of YwqJK toxin-antitoxin module
MFQKFLCLLYFLLTLQSQSQNGIGIYKLFPIEAPGFYFEYYPSGKLMVEGVYQRLDSIVCVNCYGSFTEKTINKSISNLMRVGEWKEFHENGQVKAKGMYGHVHEVYHVHWSMPYGESSKGLVPGDAEIVFLKDGAWQYFNERGQLIREEFYYKGMLSIVETYKGN